MHTVASHWKSEGEAALQTQLRMNTQAWRLGEEILQDNALEKAHLSVIEREKYSIQLKIPVVQVTQLKAVAIF